MVLYRKYRPQKIAEIDNPEVREKLEKILSSGKPPHAFLFSGPKGTGKTSSARIIAKSLNCEKNNGKGEPCNRCSTCLSITNGTNLDILEIDAASNRGIDEIRDLRDKIRLAPAGARKKIYIIDEVHMLTTEAFNALLKTLEEPPEHALFVLCTTNAEKLPETIVSRCRQIDFKKAGISDLLQSLKRAKRGEEREVDEKALEQIAQLADGSYRDAHKLLEEVLTAYPRAKITDEMVQKVLGEKEISGNLFGWMPTYDAKQGLEMIGLMAEKGVDFKFLNQTILETLHAHLLKKYGLTQENFPYQEPLENLEISDLKILINLFSKAGQELKTAIIPQLPLELAIVEWCEEKGKDAGGDEFSHPTLSSLDSTSSHSTKAKKDKDPAVSVGPSKIVTRHPPGDEVEELGTKWQEILTAVKPYNHSVAGLLRSCRPASFDGETLIIEAFYKFHYDRLSETKIRELLEKVIEELFGKKIKVFPKLKEKEVL